MSLAAAIEAASEGREVEPGLLEGAFGEIADGAASPVQIAALLVALRTKGETVGEIAAAARALRARAPGAGLRFPDAVDTCGTGGDGAGTFNVSTAAAFVVGGGGVPVAKHGNRAASSRAGSADVLEALGVEVDLPVEAAARILERAGIAFFFARRAHPAMAHVAPVRAALRVRTLMNCLGPLLNPVGAGHQLVGVYARSLVEPLAAALGALGARRALVVHGADGLDEITTTDVTFAALWDGASVRAFTVDVAELGLPRARPQDLRGGDAADNAAVIRDVLEGKGGPARDLVLANAGAALWVAGAASDLGEGVARARQSLDSGAASERLTALRREAAELR